MMGMSTHRRAPGGSGAFPLIGDLVNRVPGGRRYAGFAGAALAILILAVVASGVLSGRRVAAWAPIDVIESRVPLQELPVRIAEGNEPVPPARSYDAMLDLSSISALVVGVDLDYIPRGAARYEAVIRNESGVERFRDAIAEEYLAGGRFMLRLFARGFPAGDYSLEIEAFASEDGPGRVIAAAWFQVAR
jgi:hypothetical protein